MADQTPEELLAEAQVILSHWPRWADVRAAHREGTGDTSAVLRPFGQTDFRVK
jgi:hypothetical protein